MFFKVIKHYANCDRSEYAQADSVTDLHLKSYEEAVEVAPLVWLRECEAPQVLSRSFWSERTWKMALEAWTNGEMTDEEILAQWARWERWSEYQIAETRAKHAAWYAQQADKSDARSEAEIKRMVDRL